MREPPITSVEVISLAFAGAAIEIHSNVHTSAYQQRRRVTAAWNPVPIIREAEKTASTNMSKLVQVSNERDSGAGVPIKRSSSVSRANVPGPNSKMIRDATRNVYGAAA